MSEPLTNALSPAPSSRSERAALSPAAVAPAPVTPATEVPPPVPDSGVAIADQYTRKPAHSRTYDVAMAYVAMKAQGMRLQQISDVLGIPKDTISTYVKRAAKKGWLTAHELDSDDALEYSIPQQVVRNLGELLESRDKETTLETAKGIGIFKSHQAMKVEGQIANAFALRVQVDMPVGIEEKSIVKIREGSMGGTPAIDGEVVGEDRE